MTARPLHIALLMHSLNPRGGVVHTLELAEALIRLGQRVTLVAAGRPGQTLFRPTRAALSVAPLGDLPTGLVPMVRARIQAVAAHLRGLDLDGFDVLHSQDSLTANALADLRAEGRIAGFVRTVHHLDAFDDPQLAAWQARGVREAATLLCVSGVWQQVLQQAEKRPVHRVGNGVDLERFQPARPGVELLQAADDAKALHAIGLRMGEPYWLAVGGVEARKNTPRLLAAFARVMHRHPATRLVLAGGASLLEHGEALRAFEAVRQANGLAAGQAHAHRLLLTGPVPDAALPPLYRHATALALPSLKEGFGLVAIEAMACGTPAIVSRIAPFTEHLRPHEAFWVDPHDEGDIADALCRSLDPTPRAACAATARATAARFDWLDSARRHLALYRQAGADLRPGAGTRPSTTSPHPHPACHA